jgi:hypothetical protein
MQHATKEWYTRRVEMIRSFKNWKAKRAAKLQAAMERDNDGYSPTHDKTLVWPPQMSLYDWLVEWEEERPLFVAALAGLALIIALVALWVAPHENGWSILGQSLWDAFFVW